MYIVPGYIYLSAYYWVSFKDDKNFNNFLIKSVAVSYIISVVYQYLFWNKEENFEFTNQNVISILLLSFLCGIIFGKIISHRNFNIFLHKIHIGRTTNNNIWDDVIKPYTWVRVFMKDGTSYYGQYRYGEPFKSEPIIVLATYQKFDKDTDIVIDHTGDSNEFIMINTKDFDRIEIVYDKKIK